MKKIFLLLSIFLIFPASVLATDLEVSFDSTPLFNISNMAPGDPPVIKNFTVKNNSAINQAVGIKATKTNGNGLETGLNTTIGPYWSGKLSNLLGSEKFITILFPGEIRIIPISVILPISTGDEYQNKSVTFNIDVGVIQSDHLLISEVYYLNYHKKPKKETGLLCRLLRHAAVRKFLDCDEERIYSEWIELYNPTGKAVRLKDWQIANSSQFLKIRNNFVLDPGKFVLLAKDHEDLKYFPVPKKTRVISLGNWFKNGLNKNFDQVRLLNSQTKEVDQVSWGTEIPPAVNGQSLQRLAPGWDTDCPSDWQNNTPNPGK
jgi:hypothetical protein